MQIFATTTDGKLVAIEIYKTEKIIDVKKKIVLAPDEQKLVHQGSILEDDKTVDEYQIAEKSVILVVARRRGSMQLFARTMDGKTVAIEIQKTERIIDVKKKIQEKMGLAPDEQKLVFQGGILQDDKTVDEYQIAEKSVFNVVVRLRGGMQIIARTIDGKAFIIEISKTERVSDIKKKIQEKVGLGPDEQKLLFQGEILEDDKTVDEYQIAEKSVITVVARRRGGKQVFVKTMDVQTFAIEIQETERVSDIKKKIQEKIGLAPEQQLLFFKGSILEDDKTADEYQITEKSVINVLPRSGSIQIQIKLIDGIIESIYVMETERIIDTKRKIQERIKLAPEEQTLIYRGCVLEDEGFLDEYGITDRSQIDICTRLRCEMKVFLKTPNSETIDIGVNKYEKVSSLRRKIESATRIASNKQILIHERTVLNTDDPNKTIEEFGLKDRSIIRVIHE